MSTSPCVSSRPPNALSDKEFRKIIKQATVSAGPDAKLPKSLEPT